MAEAIIAVGTKVAFAVSAALPFGGTASTIISAAAGFATIGAGLYAIGSLSASLAPSVPEPEAAQTNIKQARPARRFGIGTTRVSGAAVFREAERNRYHQVFAYPEGPVTGFGRTWLNDDEVTIVGDAVQALANGRYETGRARVYQRVGAPTEAVYADLTSAFPSIWPPTSRGDGVPSTYLRCENGKLADAFKQFPAGAATEITREASYTAYDWRDPAQIRNDQSTWQVTGNVVVWTVNVLWRRYGADWDRRFAPALAILTAEANACDELVSLKDGGSVKRYEVGFWFEATTPRKVLLQTLLAAMDGHFSVRKDGAYIIRAGRYQEPTVAFGDEEIIDFTFNPGPTPDQAINVLAVSFCDPSNAYATMETDSWRNEEDISSRGAEQSSEFTPKGVQGNSQVRRLAKAGMDRNFAPDGTFRTPLSARRGLGERYTRLRISDISDLNDAVVEITDASVELDTATIQWTYRVASAARYEWNAATEEGDGPITSFRPPPEALSAPSISTLTPFFASTGVGGDGVRVRIDGTGPDRSDLTWFYRWRTLGATSWTERTGGDTDPTAGVTMVTGEFLPADVTIEFQIAYQTGGGTLSPWGPATPSTVSTSVSNVAPDSPTDGAVSSTGAGQAHIAWRNPSSSNFDHARVWRGGASSSFGSAVSQGVVVGAPGALASFDQTGVAAGTYRYWITAENAANTASAPIGPFSVTIV
ncbi:MAG: hypothetical protein J7521_20450 [Caulobacter sp.]|nr:hypothetical protein [Caulobacter sp.]